MPRTVDEVLAHSDDLARKFEDYEPDPAPYLALRSAVLLRSGAEYALNAAIADARDHGYTWAHIGGLLGTSGEAARQRYGKPRPSTNKPA